MRHVVKSNYLWELMIHQPGGPMNLALLPLLIMAMPWLIPRGAYLIGSLIMGKTENSLAALAPTETCVQRPPTH
jgi:hypothetical protein